MVRGVESVQCELAFRSDDPDHDDKILERDVKKYAVGQSPYSHVMLGMVPIDESRINYRLMSVTHKRRRYATLGGTYVHADQRTCSSYSHTALPDGWEIAPYGDESLAVAQMGLWGANCLVLSDGSAWSVQRAQPNMCGNGNQDNLEDNGNIYEPKYKARYPCYHHVLIRSTETVPATQLVDDNEYGFSIAAVGRWAGGAHMPSPLAAISPLRGCFSDASLLCSCLRPGSQV